MAWTPPDQTHPKPRDSIATETAFGWFLAIVGTGVIIWYLIHTSHGHPVADKTVLVFGSMALAGGGFFINKKMTVDFFHFVRDMVVFWKRAEKP